MYKEYESKFNNEFWIYGKEGSNLENKIIAKTITINGIIHLYDNYVYLDIDNIRYVADITSKIQEELNSTNNV